MEEVLRSVDAIEEYLKGLSDSELISIHNTYCEYTNNGDDTIYDNDEDFFNTNFSDVMRAVRAIFYGEYNYPDDYVKFNGYANLETTNDPSEWIDTSEVAQFILENERYFDIELIDEEDEKE
jgi:hypothetical protein